MDTSLAAQRAHDRAASAGKARPSASTIRWSGSGSAADLAVRLIRTNGMGAQVMEVGTTHEPRSTDPGVRHARPATASS